MTEAAVAENPLAEGLRMRRPPEPFALTIFGASGDLTQRKLMPALYALALRGLLPDHFAIVGVSRTPLTTEEFRARMREAVEEHGRDDFREDVWEHLAERLSYVAADFGVEGGEQPLIDCLDELDATQGTSGNRVYYLAVPPKAVGPIVTALGRARTTSGWTRLIVEKPFGYDLASARQLNDLVHQHFEEKEIYRIDHYLGKETVQNMLVLRFANGIFEPIWNRQFIDHVQITVAESLGAEGRGDFYDETGAMRDVVQNHMLQLVALTAMEPPIDFEADAVRNEKVKVLRALHTPGPKHVVRGQYGPGFIEGEPVPGYREEPGVAPDSETETYVAAKLYVDNWRWADTPFYIRTGKRLPRRETTIAIQFKRAPHPPFEVDDGEGLRPNVLLIHIQPDEGVSLAVGAKVPGQGVSIRTVHMDFLYGGAFRVEPARGLRAPDPRLPARRRDAVHARGRGGGAVGARRRDGRALGTRPAALPELRRGDLGAARRRRAAAPRRPLLAAALMPVSSLRELERELTELRAASAEPGAPPRLRASVMTHIAWVPEQWVEAATGTLAGLAERHPSRTIMLFPRPDDPRDVLEGEVDLRCFVRGGQQREVCSEVVSVRLCGRRASAPASVVMPLLVSDLPVFLRWRGPLPFGAPELDQLVGVADRLVVDSREWPDARAGLARLPELFDRIAVSDIAWARTEPWRCGVADLWPDVAEASALRVAGPEPEALLLRSWLSARLGREIRLEHEPAGELELVAVDGLDAHPARLEPLTPSDLLSDQLEVFGHDRIYEEAVRSFS